VFGFGTAILVLAVGSHILPVKETIALGTVLFTASTVTKTFLFAKHMDWKTVTIMSLVSLPFAYLGAELLIGTPPEIAKRLLGAMVLLYLLVSNIKRLPAIQVGTMGILIGSAGYGFISGLLGTGNIIKVVLFREMKMSKEAFVGSLAATSVLANLAKLYSYGSSGLLTDEMLVPAISLIIGVVIVATIGRSILSKLNVRVFELGVQILLGVAGIALLV
jgi:uncharacterized membrane protein YfcA